MREVMFFISNMIIHGIIGYNIVLFDRYIFNDKLSIKMQIAFVTLFSLGLSLLRQILNYSTVNIIVVLAKILVYVIAFILIYKVLKLKFWKAVLILCLTLISLSIGESIILVLFMTAGYDIKSLISGDNFLIYCIGSIAINMFQMIFLYLFKISKSVPGIAKGLKNKTYLYVTLNIILAVIAITTTMGILCFTKQKPLIISFYVAISLIGLLCNIFSINLILKVDVRDEQLKMQEQYNGILVDLKHKFFGIMSIMTALSEKEDITGLKEYIREIDKGFVKQIQNMPTNIKNNKLFYLVAVKINEAQEHGVSLKVLIPYEINDIKGIREDDLIYVINELLSNAIEHSEKSEEKEAYLRIENINDRTNVIIENSISQEDKENKVSILTNKSKRVGRGNGLKQVKKLIGDNTYLKISILDRFIAELSIDKEV